MSGERAKSIAGNKAREDFPGSHLVSPFWIRTHGDDGCLMMGDVEVGRTGPGGTLLSVDVDESRGLKIMAILDSMRAHQREMRDATRQRMATEINKTLCLLRDEETHHELSFEDAYHFALVANAVMCCVDTEMSEGGIHLFLRDPMGDERERLWTIKHDDEGMAVLDGGWLDEETARRIILNHKETAAVYSAKAARKATDNFQVLHPFRHSMLIGLMRACWDVDGRTHWGRDSGRNHVELTFAGEVGLMNLRLNGVILGVIRPVCDHDGPALTVERTYHSLSSETVLNAASWILADEDKTDLWPYYAEKTNFEEMIDIYLDGADSIGN